MRTVSAMDLRRRLGEILDSASAGEHVVIERGRRPLAVLVPYEDAMRLQESPADARARAVAALDRLEALAHRMRDQSDASADAATAVREDRTIGHEVAG